MPSSAPAPDRPDARRGQLVQGLAERHGAYLRRLAGRLCKGELDADDLVQDVLEKLLHREPPTIANERAWLARVTYNLFIDRVRQRRPRREHISAEPAGTIAIEREAPRRWDLLDEQAVRAALDQLPADQRTTFELFVFGGKRYDEIAAMLGIAKATVGTRILRARNKLRGALLSARRE